jgi:hypothetical protein
LVHYDIRQKGNNTHILLGLALHLECLLALSTTHNFQFLLLPFAMATETTLMTTTTSVPEDAVQMRRLGRNGTVVEQNNLNLTGEDHIGPDTRSAEEAQEYPTGLKFWLIILIISALVALGGLDTNIVATAVPRYVLGS